MMKTSISRGLCPVLPLNIGNGQDGLKFQFEDLMHFSALLLGHVAAKRVQDSAVASDAEGPVLCRVG